MGLAHLVNVLGGQALQTHQLLLTEKTIALLAKRLRPQTFRAVNETPTKNDDLVSKTRLLGVSRRYQGERNSDSE